MSGKMKTFKQYVEDEKDKIPSLLISQGEHSRKKIKEEALDAA